MNKLTELEEKLYQKIVTSYLCDPTRYVGYVVSELWNERPDLYTRDFARHLRKLYDLGLIKVGISGVVSPTTPYEIAQMKQDKQLKSLNK